MTFIGLAYADNPPPAPLRGDLFNVGINEPGTSSRLPPNGSGTQFVLTGILILADKDLREGILL